MVPQDFADERGEERGTAAEIEGLAWVGFSQRRAPPPDRRRMWILLAAVLALHVVLVAVWYFALRPTARLHAPVGAIAVTLVEPATPLPAPPSLAAPPPPLPGQPARAPLPPPPVRHVPPAKGAMQATLEGAHGQSLHLYGANGEIVVPPTSAPPAPPAAYRTPELKGSHIYSGKSPVPYNPTRFAQGFEPTNRSLGARGAEAIGRVYEKAVDKTTLQKTVRLPGKIKVHCALSPLLLFAGCSGEPPAPPPKNDNDIRLSMPPAETLLGKKVPLPSSASSVAPRASGTRPQP